MANIGASTNGMDKVTMKKLFSFHNIPLVPYKWYYREDLEKNIEKILDDIEKNILSPFIS